MVRLRKIKFTGFQADQRVADVKFSEDQVSVIYGENGCGKTTFLKLLHAVFVKDSAILVKEKVELAEIEYVYEGKNYFVNVFRTKADLLEDQANEIIIRGAYDWSSFENSHLNGARSLSLGVERGVTTQASKIDTIDVLRLLQGRFSRVFNNRVQMHDFAEELVFSIRKMQVVRSRNQRDELDLYNNHCYLQNIKLSNIENLLLERYKEARSIVTEKIQNALFDTLASAIEQSKDKDKDIALISIPSDLGSTILKSKERIIEALKDGAENNFKSSFISFLEGFKRSDDIYRVRENQILLQLIVNMVNQLQIERQMLSSINIFIDNFNKYLSGGKELIVTKDEIYVDVDGVHCSIDSLSSGERHVFTFLSLIVVAGRGRDFLIIDEPEISLNIKWQRGLVALLKTLLPDTQIILASHSPSISNKSPQSLVELSPYKVESND